MYPSGTIASVVNGQHYGQALQVTYLSVDSRKISFPSQTLFFALVTKRRNGHHFIGEAYNQGVRCFMVSEPVSTALFKDCAVIRVPDTLIALQHLAAWHRSQFEIPVIGITGSNGKTIVKEWLNQLLQEKNKVVRSPKSFNSQIGVPLSVWQINSSHTVGIFEAGISKPGEMEGLQKIIQPTIGILTNIGAAHDEGFGSRQQKLEEKLSLFSSVKVLIYCADNEMIWNSVCNKGIPSFTWGKSEACDMQVTAIEASSTLVQIQVRHQNKNLPFALGFTDEASIENALHCIALMLYSGIDAADIASRLLQLHRVEMRLEWKKAINNCHLLNDSYSNDISSFIIALNYLEQQQQGNKRTVILSDFFESGLTDEALYTMVAGLLKQHKIERLLAVGKHIGRFIELFKSEAIDVLYYPDTQALLTSIDQWQFANENILLKGARRFEFEKIVTVLEEQVHQTVLEINLTALATNLQYYRQLLAPQTKIMVMVKAFGYGSGDAEVARVLQFNKVDYLAVAYTDEGVALRKAGVHLPVMVMNPEPASFEPIERYNLEPEIYSFSILEKFQRYCQAQGISQYPVHIKLDTGMRRLGFETHEIEALANLIAGNETLVIKTVFTHLAASEDERHDAFTNEQTAAFLGACEILEKTIGYSFIKHAANTAAIVRHPDKHFDMVRLGIGLYGAGTKNENLQVVSSLKTTVAQVKKVAAGQTVGYGRMGVVTRESVIATVRIGYADGFRRQLGNGVGKMFVRNQMAPIIGNVCMDMTMLDVTDIIGVAAGDSVEVFGSVITIGNIASLCHTIPYEIMTGISQRVKRVYMQE